MATETWYAAVLQLKPTWKTNIQMKCLEKSGHFFLNNANERHTNPRRPAFIDE